ncbi:MAG: hypothetical protein WAL99_08600, partial [Pseudonocardiaceae bacterium]
HWQRPTRPARPGAGRVRQDRFRITATCGKTAEKKAGMGVTKAVPVGPPPEQTPFNNTRHAGRDTHPGDGGLEVEPQPLALGLIL